MEIKETDKLFTDSPDAGDYSCICSRCGKKIEERESPITRVFVEDDETDMIYGEYRFCNKCDGLIRF